MGCIFGRYTRRGRGHQDFLVNALKAGADATFVDGRVLAKLGGGELALVPASTQKGDITSFVH